MSVKISVTGPSLSLGAASLSRLSMQQYRSSVQPAINATPPTTEPMMIALRCMGASAPNRSRGRYSINGVSGREVRGTFGSSIRCIDEMLMPDAP
ncbi:hypothetical protein LSCM1_05489 [Leishmania martiniquensis]|uniref:Uncharacterized protein n=1 Tax=Leishmania martiniquensis TaxID=1580590 RepID=A0A836KN24_9TRYP|nr:hypothetical protein LSCM1_05489 [Leishmania martiniquensis]